MAAPQQVEVVIYPEDTLSDVLFRVVAATSEWGDGHIHQGQDVEDARKLGTALIGLDPLWRQAAAALSVGPGEFAHFQVEMQWGIQNHARLLREYLEKCKTEAELVKIRHYG